MKKIIFTFYLYLVTLGYMDADIICPPTGSCATTLDCTGNQVCDFITGCQGNQCEDDNRGLKYKPGIWANTGIYPGTCVDPEDTHGCDDNPNGDDYGDEYFCQALACDPAKPGKWTPSLICGSQEHGKLGSQPGTAFGGECCDPTTERCDIGWRTCHRKGYCHYNDNDLIYPHYGGSYKGCLTQLHECKLDSDCGIPETNEPEPTNFWNTNSSFTNLFSNIKTNKPSTNDPEVDCFSETRCIGEELCTIMRILVDGQCISQTHCIPDAKCGSISKCIGPDYMDKNGTLTKWKNYLSDNPSFEAWSATQLGTPTGCGCDKGNCIDNYFCSGENVVKQTIWDGFIQHADMVFTSTEQKTQTYTRASYQANPGNPIYEGMSWEDWTTSKTGSSCLDTNPKIEIKVFTQSGSELFTENNIFTRDLMVQISGLDSDANLTKLTAGFDPNIEENKINQVLSRFSDNGGTTWQPYTSKVREFQTSSHAIHQIYFQINSDVDSIIISGYGLDSSGQKGQASLILNITNMVVPDGELSSELDVNWSYEKNQKVTDADINILVYPSK